MKYVLYPRLVAETYLNNSGLAQKFKQPVLAMVIWRCYLQQSPAKSSALFVRWILPETGQAWWNSNQEERKWRGKTGSSAIQTGKLCQKSSEKDTKLAWGKPKGGIKKAEAWRLAEKGRAIFKKKSPAPGGLIGAGERLNILWENYVAQK